MFVRTAVPVLVASAAVLAALLGSGGEGQEQPRNQYARILDARSKALVGIRFVLSHRGPSGESAETSVEATGVAVNPSGLVMISNSALQGDDFQFESPGESGQAGKPEVSNFTVAFPGDEKEYDAFLVATDARAGLAFIAIRNLDGRKVDFVDFAQGSARMEPGTELAGVDRLGKQFDYAPYFERFMVCGEVRQPMRMFVVSSGLSLLGLPLFDSAGSPAGAVIEHSGGEFMLPADAVAATVAAAAKKAEEAAKKAAEEKK